MDRRLIKEPFFLTSIAVLLLAPWFVYGEPHISTLLLRASVPPLLLLSWHAARATISRLPEMDGHPAGIINTSTKLYITLVVALIIGAVPAVYRYRSILSEFGGNNFEQSAVFYQQMPVYFMIDNQASEIPEKTTYQPPDLLEKLLKTNQPGRINKIGELLFNNKYDVYLTDENRLVYVNRDCQPPDEKNTTYLLHIYPTDPNNLPTSRREAGYETSNFVWSDIYYRGNTDCVTGSPKLPSYDIDRIVTGQYRPAEKMIWLVEYKFNSASATDLIDNDYLELDLGITSRPFKATVDPTFNWIATQEPLIDSVFDIYLSDGRIIYARQPCHPDDADTPFVLHIIPDNPDDLPDHRTTDFDNYDFDFDDRGVISDDKCLAIADLPTYEIARIRTGQWNREHDLHLWLQEAPVSR